MSNRPRTGELTAPDRPKRKIVLHTDAPIALPMSVRTDLGKEYISHPWERQHCYIPPYTIRCRDCGGRGLVSDLARMEYPESGHVVLEIGKLCTACDGRGHFTAHQAYKRAAKRKDRRRKGVK